MHRFVARQAIRLLRVLSPRIPFLRRIRGRLGVARRLAAAHPIERLTLDGDIVIELDLRVPQFINYYFFKEYLIESDLPIIRRLLNPSSVVVDAGAHIGVYALLAAKYAGQVIAFEPSPETCQRMERNLQLNPRLAEKITLHKVALSDHNGELTLYHASASPQETSFRLPTREQTVAIPVPVVRLDDVLGDVRVDFLKIDIEGAELDALRGSEQILRQSRPLVLCELNEERQQKFGRSVRDLVAFLEALGYAGLEMEVSRESIRAKPLRHPDELVAHLTHVERFMNALFVTRAELDAVTQRLTRAEVG